MGYAKVVRNSMVILALSILAAAGAESRAEDMRSQPDQAARANVPMPPVMMLPGMRTSASEALPQPLITDVINIPNPFDSRKAGRAGQTQVAYRLGRDVPVTVTLYDLLGFRVRRWTFGAGQNGGRQGVNSFWWDGANETGRKVSKGGYIAQIEIDLPGAAVSAIRKIGVIH